MTGLAAARQPRHGGLPAAILARARLRFCDAAGPGWRQGRGSVDPKSLKRLEFRF